VPPLVWTEELSTGIRAIDNDHRMLFDIANALHACAEQGGDPDEIGRHLEALIRYAEEHFAREETFMERSGYPGLDAHMREHQCLTAAVYRLQDMHAADPANVTAPQLWAFLSDWLVGHIRNGDMAYVPYLRGQSPGAAEPRRRAMRAVTVRVPDDRVGAVLICADLLARGGAEAEDLLRLIGAPARN